MTQTRRRFPKSFQREAVDQVLAGTPLRHVAETLGIAESLLGKWKRQYEQQGNDSFPGNGKQRDESAELRRLRQQLAQVTMQRDVLKKHSPSSRSPRSEVSRNRGVGRSLSRSTDVPATAGMPQQFLCLAPAACLADRDGVSASEQRDPHYPPRGEWDLWPSPNQGRVGGHGACVRSTTSRSTDARSWSAYPCAQALAAGLQQSSCSADCPEAPGSLGRVGSRQSVLRRGHDLRADGPRMAVSARRARSLFARCRHLGDAQSDAASPSTCCSGDGRCMLIAERTSAAALGSWQPILRVRLPSIASATPNRAQLFTSG